MYPPPHTHTHLHEQMVQPADAETAKQTLIKKIMRDDSITQQEKQLRVQVLSLRVCV
jgi:hypothetical protein